ncbi:MAG: hypothetical protein CVU41_15135 [Chloroflexi bacterium HGW-Chloroflexi-3]|nr:MAG: hypothetical protein CVU41_15135 [Chloroflexi bacterium HGW-Chloroflexi-3]
MISPLQKTKLFAPTSRTRWVGQPRLSDHLNAILSPGCKAALLSAPAGSGMTTIAIQWLVSQKGLPAAWVLLDERDNQPALFFRYLIIFLALRFF